MLYLYPSKSKKLICRKKKKKKKNSLHLPNVEGCSAIGLLCCQLTFLLCIKCNFKYSVTHRVLKGPNNQTKCTKCK